MLGRLFRRRTAAAAGPAKPGLGARIRGFFVALWNWTILLAAIVGMLVCARLAVGFWMTGSESVDIGTTLGFGAMAVAAALAAAFLAWQSWRGIRYLRHRRMQ